MNLLSQNSVFTPQRHPGTLFQKGPTGSKPSFQTDHVQTFPADAVTNRKIIPRGHTRHNRLLSKTKGLIVSFFISPRIYFFMIPGKKNFGDFIFFTLMYECFGSSINRQANAVPFFLQRLGLS